MSETAKQIAAGKWFLVLGTLLVASGSVSAAPPPLPSGLGGDAPPALPSGLGGEAASTAEVEESDDEANKLLPFELHGFAELRVGGRLQNAPGFSDSSLREARLQLQMEEYLGASSTFKAVMDFVYDDLDPDRGFDWEDGSGWLDPRELWLSTKPVDAVDLKLGRQVATWGVGDLLFINDLFPKDWNSFFLGRDLEYLKAPQDSLRASYFSDWVNLDLVYSPRFEPDRFIDGQRLSFWSEASGSLTEQAVPMDPVYPGGTFDSDELHLRLSRILGRFELAAYGYWGYWKSPAGVDTATGRALFPELEVFGASARGPIGSGLLSAEIGAYESVDDPAGEDPFTRNSELRLLLGYERELGNELTGSAQYYVERTRDYAAADSVADRDRDLVTLRLRKQLWQQTLTLNAFVFYSPSQEDHYTRLSASWKASDEWRWDVGANLFGGEDWSFFGQFGRNENLYLAARRSF
ncbi:hypothetical protein [Pelagicoccus sp. SDUM812003]|uniref:hypothetical protein n=1 Tax=Pelagicoccus sp. SDUM812003 TaxID=3041267 RepID=UPI00280EB6EB|nr:hypothetical protein [Pelagicoccus sp. SDUM812003]MDQ8204425.1 hypothetical protein [Pelagicoccus sp. SDUM812003]